MKKFLKYWGVVLLMFLAADFYFAFSGSKTALFYGWDAFFMLGIVIACIMIPSLLIGLVLTHSSHYRNTSTGQNFSGAAKAILVIIIVLAALFISRALFF